MKEIIIFLFLTSFCGELLAQQPLTSENSARVLLYNHDWKSIKNEPVTYTHDQDGKALIFQKDKKTIVIDLVNEITVQSFDDNQEEIGVKFFVLEFENIGSILFGNQNYREVFAAFLDNL